MPASQAKKTGRLYATAKRAGRTDGWQPKQLLLSAVLLHCSRCLRTTNMCSLTCPTSMRGDVSKVNIQLETVQIDWKTMYSTSCGAATGNCQGGVQAAEGMQR